MFPLWNIYNPIFISIIEYLRASINNCQLKRKIKTDRLLLLKNRIRMKFLEKGKNNWI